jgi:hypothetical protein
MCEVCEAEKAANPAIAANNLLNQASSLLNAMEAEGGQQFFPGKWEELNTVVYGLDILCMEHLPGNLVEED